VQEWCATAFECLEIHGFIRRRVVLPTPIEETEPFEGQGAPGGLVCLPLLALLRRVDRGPAGRPRGFRGPLHNGVPQERRTLEAPVPPGLLPAACCHRGHPRICLEFLSRSVAFPLFANGHEAARGKDRTGAWSGGQSGDVWMVLGAWRDGVINVGEGLHGDAELGDEGLHQEDIGGDDAVIGSQRSRALDGLDAGRDHVGRRHVVGPEAVFQGRAPRELGGVEGRPAAQAGTKDRGIFVLKPREDMRAGVVERTGQAVGQTDVGADQATAVLDAWRQGAHGGALGAEWGELVAVFEEALAREFGISGGIVGPARGKRFTVLGHGERIDGQEPEEIIVAPRGYERPLRTFQAHRDGLSVASRA
jgi:hypothetical protein